VDISAIYVVTDIITYMHANSHAATLAAGSTEVLWLANDANHITQVFTGNNGIRQL